MPTRNQHSTGFGQGSGNIHVGKRYIAEYEIRRAAGQRKRLSSRAHEVPVRIAGARQMEASLVDVDADNHVGASHCKTYF
jgi:hypothetical protein